MDIEPKKRKGTVFILFNDLNSRYRFRAAKFVQGSGYVPVYPAIVGDFFEVNQKKFRGVDEKDQMIRKADEMWVFGAVNSSMQDQIELALRLKKKLRFFYVLNGQFWEKDQPQAAPLEATH